MCSIGEDDFGDEGGIHAMIPDEKLEEECVIATESQAQLCSKCKKPGAVFKLAFRQAECRECFLLYTRHKFRAALGSSKVLPKDAKVILVCDGSAESVVLLDMLHHAQTQNAFKRLHCTATVLYIDDFHLLEQNQTSAEVYKAFLENVEICLKQYTYFDSFIVPLVDTNNVVSCLTNIKNAKEQIYYLRYMDEKQSLIKLVNSITSLTSRQDFVKHLRSKIIAVAAKHLESKFAFMPDISPCLASDLLAAVALGRGGSAALDVALVDDRLSNNIKLIRPLKDLNTNEIQLYLIAQNLKPLQTIRYGMKEGSMASLQNLTKAFVDNLQQNFSSTISTVFRTGDKIAVNKEIMPDLDMLSFNDRKKENMEVLEKRCSFCNSLLDYRDSTTLLAIEFSRLVSESSYTLDKTTELNSKAKENVNGLENKSYIKKLCHACRNICAESPDESLLINANKVLLEE